MAEPSTHINYSFEDIQRYLQRKMSAAEMHTIEKAALQDTFLADAIEGYTDIDPAIAKQHLNAINASLSQQKKESKVVAFNRKTQWLSIAALVIILAGAGAVFSYFLRSSNKQQQTAQIKKDKVIKNTFEDSISSGLIAPGAKQDTTLLIAENKNLKKEKTLEKKPAKRNLTSTSEDSQQAETSITAMAMSAPMQNKAASKTLGEEITLNSKNDSNSNVLPNTFSGKVLDENGNPVAGVIVQSADKKTATFTNVNGNFSLKKNDSIINVTASTIGYESRTANLKSGNNDPIILRGTNSGVNDVILTTAGISKKSKISKDSASPVGGWANFNNYVMSKLNKDTTNALLTNSEDLVEIEFLIDNNGNPYDIKITKPLDEQHNAKAIDILKSGPKWTHSSNSKKAKVAISF